MKNGRLTSLSEDKNQQIVTGFHNVSLITNKPPFMYHEDEVSEACRRSSPY
jgi:hypothetical protein